MNVSPKSQHTHSSTRSSVTQGFKCALLATLFIFAGQAIAQSQEMLRHGTPDPASPSAPQAPLAEKVLPTLAQMDPVELNKLENMLAGEVERAANAQPRLKGQGKVFHVKARFDVVRDVLVVDLGKSYVPLEERYITVQLEEHLHALDAIVDDLVRGVIGNFRGVDHRFGGKPLHHYLPDPVQIPASKPKVTSATTSAAAAITKVMLNAGHGWYLHPTLGWTSQRDVEVGSGILEDTTTPLHVLELSNWMTERGTTILSRPRSTSTATHAPSGKPWWWVGSRAYVQDLLPNNPLIWNSLPTYSYLDNDLRTRPLYANFVEAEALISIHTNGAPENRAKRGTEVHIQGADSGSQNSLVESQRLGESILCYMKEVIQASPNYAQWSVESLPRFINTAETRLGTMPSVIVEVGYHTNLDDAAALQNATFRTAAMKGVEKGYRLNAEGNTTCEPFKISSIPDVVEGTTAQTLVHNNYVGHPQFPVKRKTEVVSCPGSMTCKGSEITFQTKTPSPLVSTFTCGSAAAGIVRLRATLTDMDGVKTNPVEFNITCKA